MQGFFEKIEKVERGSRSGIISNIWASILSKNGGYRVSMIKIKDYVRVGSLEEAYEPESEEKRLYPGWDALDEDGAEAGADGD